MGGDSRLSQSVRWTKILAREKTREEVWKKNKDSPKLYRKKRDKVKDFPSGNCRRLGGIGGGKAVSGP